MLAARWQRDELRKGELAAGRRGKQSAERRSAAVSFEAVLGERLVSIGGGQRCFRPAVALLLARVDDDDRLAHCLINPLAALRPCAWSDAAAIERSILPAASLGGQPAGRGEGPGMIGISA